ncbi:hypothetical protein D3C80_928560 [compost metagenome]
MTVHPFLGNRHELLIEAKAALTIIFEGKIRLDACRCAYHRTRTACWRLGNNRNVADSFFLDRVSDLRIYLGHHFHEAALQILICFKCRERAFLCCNFSRSQIGFLRNKAVQLIEEFQRFRASIADFQLDHQLGKSHSSKTYAALLLLILFIFFKVIRCLADDIIQETNRIMSCRCKLIPGNIMILFIIEFRQVHRRQITYAPARQPLLAARVCTNNRVEIPAVGHLIVVFHKYDARLCRFPC